MRLTDDTLSLEGFLGIWKMVFAQGQAEGDRPFLPVTEGFVIVLFYNHSSYYNSVIGLRQCNLQCVSYIYSIIVCDIGSIM